MPDPSETELTFELFQEISMDLQVGPPAVAAVRIGSSSSTSSFNSLVDPSLGLGYYVREGEMPLPWTNANELSITFSEPVTQPELCVLGHDRVPKSRSSRASVERSSARGTTAST